jgi:MoaA/NifB/PqqE/SkfB family radical SAM enzyme
MKRYGEVLGYIAGNLWRREALFPFYASFKITRRCGLRCPFCDSRGDDGVREASTGEIVRIMRNLPPSVLVLCLEGGEPFLRPDIEEILREASRLPLFVSAVTSYPPKPAAPYGRLAGAVDYLQISIDEGHGNLALFDELPGIRREWGVPVGVQTVVTGDTLGRIGEKLAMARRAGVKIVFMPGADLDGSGRFTPPRDVFARTVRMMKNRYPGTVATSRRFLDAYGRAGSCSTASVIIDCDGGLFYPCRTMGEKPFSLLVGGMETFLRSGEAAERRRRMAECRRACGWYQYRAVSFSSLQDLAGDMRAAVERM